MGIACTDTVIADLMRLSSVNVFSEDERRKAIKEIELTMTGMVRDEDIGMSMCEKLGLKNIIIIQYGYFAWTLANS